MRKFIQRVQAAISAAIVLGATALPTTPVQAGLRTQSVSQACSINGHLVVPTVNASSTYGWSFVANFDHAVSPNTVTTCFAERYYGQATSYTVSNTFCTVSNNSAGVGFGAGVAPFDGNAYLSCGLPVSTTRPLLFWTRANFVPNAVAQSYTFLASPSASFTAQTNASCGLTLNSQYALRLSNSVPNTLGFAHTSSASCGVFNEVRSRVVRSTANNSEGWHMANGVTLGPVTAAGALQLPQNFVFTVGAPGEPYTLDWLLIDPTPQKSTGG
jgi:hypothetical protein